MIRKEIILGSETGLHAKPASLLVKQAAKFKSDIRLFRDGKEYNGKSIMGILSMGAGKGDKIIIQAIGEDKEVAVAELVDLLVNRLGD